MSVLQIVSVVVTMLLCVAVIKALIKAAKLKKQQKAYQLIKSSIEEAIIRNSKPIKEFEETPEFKELDEIARKLVKVKNCFKPYLVKLKEEASNECSKEAIVNSLEETVDSLASTYINEQLNYFYTMAEAEKAN